MRLSRAAWIVTLTVALMPGCAWFQSLTGKPKRVANKPVSSSVPAANTASGQLSVLQPVPAPVASAPAATTNDTVIAQPSNLEPKVEALDGRLDRIERMLTEVRNQGQQRQRQEQQSRNELVGLRQETRQSQSAIGQLQKQLTTQHAAVMQRLKETPGQPVDFWAVDIPMGRLPSQSQGAEMRRIPGQVPDKAREILVYTQVATGSVKAGPHRFRIAVRVEGAREAGFYLYAVGQPQQSWAYNSDNVWLPMPRDRQLILRAEGEAFFGDWSSEVRIIAWR